MIIRKQCKYCKKETNQDRVVKRKIITYKCNECGGVRIHSYPRKIKDSEKAKYLKQIEMIA